MPAHVPGHFLDAAPAGLVLVPLLAAAVLFLSQRAKAAILVSVVLGDSAVLGRDHPPVLTAGRWALGRRLGGAAGHRAACRRPERVMLIGPPSRGGRERLRAGWFRRKARRAEGVASSGPCGFFSGRRSMPLSFGRPVQPLRRPGTHRLASVALVALSGGAEALIAGMRYLLVSLLDR
jgi:hypothetical protein